MAAATVLAALASPDLAGYEYDTLSVFDARAIYRKRDPAIPYTYTIGSDPLAAGRNGYLGVGVFNFEGPILFRKPVADEAVFDYANVDFDVPPEELLAKLNTLGAQGFCKWAGSNTQLTTQYLMRRLEAAPANCTYQMDTAVRTGDELFQRIQDLGRSGYSHFGTIFGTPFFVRDTTQKVRYSYEVVAAPRNIEELLTQFNEQGARGALRYAASADLYTYRRTTDCTRAWLCGP